MTLVDLILEIRDWLRSLEKRVDRLEELAKEKKSKVQSA